MLKIGLLEKYKSKSVLIKLVLSFICTPIFSAIILSLLLFFSFRQSSMDDINNMTRLVLSNMNTRISSILDNSKDIVYQAYRNSDILAMLYSYDNSVDTTLKNHSYFTNIMISNSYISSFYVYSSTTDTMQTFNSGTQVIEEDKKQILGFINQKKVLQIIPRQVKNTAGKNLNLFSIYYGEFNSDSTVDNVIIINLKADMIYEELYSEPADSFQDVIIADVDGIVLMNRNMDLFMRDISYEPFMQDMKKAGNSSGYIDILREGQNLAVNYVNNTEYELVSISINEQNYFVSRLAHARNTTILACLIILLLVLLVTVIITYKLFNPIDNIFNNIRGFFKESQSQSSYPNEFQYISQSISKFVERMNSLEKDKENSLLLRKNNFVKNLLTTSVSLNDASVLENLQNFNLIDNTYPNYCIIVIRFDNFKAFCDNNSLEAIYFQTSSVGSIASELLASKARCTSYEIDLEHIVLFIDYVEQNKQWILEDLRNVLIEFKETVMKLFNLSITIGISDSSDSVEHLRDLYKQAFDLTNYRLLYGKGSVLDKNLIPNKDSMDLSFNHCVDAAIDALKKGFRVQYNESMIKLIDACKYFTYEKIIMILCKTAMLIINVPRAIGLELKNTIQPDQADIYTKLKSFEDLGELLSWFGELFDEVNQQLNQVNNSKAYDLMSQVFEYISSNFFDSLLSSNMIADNFSITPQYFSKIFNETAGCSFPDYLNNLRLEKAKELLHSNSNLAINDIYKQVGYNSRNYFTAAFKSKYGVTPSKFRDMEI